MISKSVFLEAIDKLQTIFDGKFSERQIELYYEIMSPDFTDADFITQLNHVLKESFRFPPPIAAFYRNIPKTDFICPVTDEERELLRRTRELYV